MDPALAHIMMGNATFRENYARLAPNARILASDSKENSLLRGLEEELDDFCREYGGHLVTTLSAIYTFSSCHNSVAINDFYTSHEASGKPEAVLRSVREVIKNPWDWLLEKFPQSYQEHSSFKHGRFKRFLTGDTERRIGVSAYRASFVVELNDGKHQFTIHKS